MLSLDTLSVLDRPVEFPVTLKEFFSCLLSSLSFPLQQGEQQLDGIQSACLPTTTLLLPLTLPSLLTLSPSYLYLPQPPSLCEGSPIPPLPPHSVMMSCICVRRWLWIMAFVSSHFTSSSYKCDAPVWDSAYVCVSVSVLLFTLPENKCKHTCRPGVHRLRCVLLVWMPA